MEKDLYTVSVSANTVDFVKLGLEVTQNQVFSI